MNNLLAALLALAPSLAGAAASDLTGNGLDFTRLPLSASQEATGGGLGTYDVLRVFANPAFLAYQPRTWEISAATQLRGTELALHSLAAGWAGQPTETGIFGVALLASAYTMPSFDEHDIFRADTGVTVRPAGQQVGVAGMFHWKFAAFGAGYRFASEDYGLKELAARTAHMIDGGFAVTLGSMDIGAAYRGIGTSSMVTVAGAARLTGSLKGSIGGEWNLPLVQSVDSYGGAGVTLDLFKQVSVRLGARYTGADVLLCVGASAPIKNFSFDYTITAPLSGGLGPNLHIGVNWFFGKERAQPEGPKFFLEEKERTLAVMDFEARNTAAGDAGVITDILRSALVKEGAFNVVEKASMDRVLQEQAFQQTGCTTSECAVKLGKILNVRYLVVGTFGKTMGSSIVQMRVVAVETAKIIYTDEVEGETLSAMRAGIQAMAHRMTEAVKQ